jgi:hypothetical protein
VAHHPYRSREEAQAEPFDYIEQQGSQRMQLIVARPHRQLSALSDSSPHLMCDPSYYSPILLMTINASTMEAVEC